MKKTLLTLSMVALSVAAFAQGKVTIANDSAHAVTLADSAHIRAQDAALANSAVPNSGPLPSGVTLVLGLYAGTSSGSLALQTVILTVNPNGGNGNANGTITSSHDVLTVAGGQQEFLQVKIWDSSFASYEAELANGGAFYAGTSSIFTMTPGTSIAYPSILNGGGSTFQSGPLLVQIIPEPSTFALAGLGAAALLIFRRRK